MCEALLVDDLQTAVRVAQQEYLFLKPSNAGRNYTRFESVQVFVRDGFLDRYSGKRLIFPPVLRLLSHRLPTAFPYHPNWKMDSCHIAYWELTPTVDHVLLVARGGSDNSANWVTTSMLRNSAKSNWTLDELGWSLVPAGNGAEWDGLVGWFLDYIQQNPSLLKESCVRSWHTAIMRVVGNGEQGAASDTATRP